MVQDRAIAIVVLNLFFFPAILPSDWLAEPYPNDAYRGVSLHKDQLLQDPLTFKQNSSYKLFWFFHYIFSFFFTVLVVHPHNDHPVTTVLTHYSPIA